MYRLSAFLDTHRDKAALALRLAFGAHLMVVSTHLFSPGGQREFAGYLASIHVPFPLLSAYLAHVTEFFGGLALVVGLLVRPAAAALVFTFLVAVGVALKGQPYAKQAPAIQMLAVSLFFLVHGAGVWSLDGLIRKRA